MSATPASSPYGPCEGLLHSSPSPMHLVPANIIFTCPCLAWRANGAETLGPSQCLPQTCTVEVVLAVGEIFQERDALCLVVVASGCL